MWKVTDIRPNKDYGGDIVVEFTNPTEPLDRRRRTKSFISETDAREGIPAYLRWLEDESQKYRDAIPVCERLKAAFCPPAAE